VYKKLKGDGDLKTEGRARRKQSRILEQIERTPAGRFSICTVCGDKFEQVWREKYNNYSQFDRCGKCRSENACGKSLEVAYYSPHPKQKLIHESNARFRLLCAGTRFGKDRCMVHEFIRLWSIMMSERERDASLVPRIYGWIVAPTYLLAKQNWRELNKYFPKKWIVKAYKSDMEIHTLGDGVIEVRSANDPELLVGVGLDILLLTEAGKVPQLDQTWINLETRLMSPGRGPGGKGGVGLINGTPAGKNFYHTMYQWGQKDSPQHRKGWESWQFPSFDNPYLGQEDFDYFEDLRAHFPERQYRQEVLAQFIAEGNCAFSDCDNEDNFYYGSEEPQAGETYTIGYDPAKTVDYAAFVIRNSQGSAVKIGLWSGVPYPEQVRRIAELSRRYNFARVIMDSRGVGETLPAELVRLGVEVESVKITNELKNNYVNHLQFLIEQKVILYPKDEQLIAQMKDYEYKTTRTGITTYGPSTQSGHDDFVDAMCLAFKDYQMPEATMPFMGLLTGIPKDLSLN